MIEQKGFHPPYNFCLYCGKKIKDGAESCTDHNYKLKAVRNAIDNQKELDKARAKANLKNKAEWTPRTIRAWNLLNDILDRDNEV